MHSFAARSIGRLVFRDQVRIRRPVNRAAGTFDRSTGLTTFDPGDVVYDGLGGIEAAASDRTEAGSVVERSVLDLSLDADGVRVGDVAEVVLAEADRGLEGRWYRVVRVLAESSGATRRFEVELVTQVPAPSGP